MQIRYRYRKTLEERMHEVITFYTSYMDLI